MRPSIAIRLSALLLVLWAQGVRAQEEADPYLWLEDVEGQKALSWVKERSEATLAVLRSQPLFDQTRQKALEILNSHRRIAYVEFQGTYLYNFWQDEKNERGIWRRTTSEEYLKPSPQWEVLLDIDKLSQEEGEQWVFKGATGLYPDYALYMVYLSRGGGDAQVGREFDARLRQFVRDGFYLPEAKGSISWKDPNTVYVQTDFGPGSLTQSGYPRIAKIWKRGSALSAAQLVFEGEASDVGVGCAAIHTPERRYDVISREITFYTSHTYVMEGGRPIQLEIPDDAIFGGFFKNQLLVRLRSGWTTGQATYRQGSLISIDYDRYLHGDRRFTTIVEPNERSSITSHSNTRDILLVEMLDNVKSELYGFQFKENRQRCYDDLAAVAEDLIKRKVTSPQHLGIMGGSNGGLLVGAVMTQRPDLFNAVVCQVPLLDMRRYNKLLAGASWMAEYGNPDIPEEWAYIKRYSPYHNLSPDKKYPQVLFYTSTKDDRVHPGHARKMAAKMEGMGHKVYYYENTEGGHAAAATNRQRALREAISYTYLWMQLR